MRFVHASSTGLAACRRWQWHGTDANRGGRTALFRVPGLGAFGSRPLLFFAAAFGSFGFAALFFVPGAFGGRFDRRVLLECGRVIPGVINSISNNVMSDGASCKCTAPTPHLLKKRSELHTHAAAISSCVLVVTYEIVQYTPLEIWTVTRAPKNKNGHVNIKVTRRLCKRANGIIRQRWDTPH